SRRRHTSFSRDWSSDVCSSDLRVMLGVRLREGLGLDALTAQGRTAVAGLMAAELIDGPAALGAGRVPARVVLTRRGRLLADTVEIGRAPRRGGVELSGVELALH